MFAQRFDALMNIAEVSNSRLGREINMNGSHIGRLRSGARPLPKKHEFIAPVCRYLTEHITKDYQLTALIKLTGMDDSALESKQATAQYLQTWLLEQQRELGDMTGRLISGFAQLAAGQTAGVPERDAEKPLQKYAAYLYGNDGKRRAVEQFFLKILQEDRPLTLLLFSDENMAWLYEDAAFADRWAELFARVLRKGSRVRIIHTVSRDLNELLEAVMKWVPTYMTGAIEPFYYPRLRDGLFQRTLFIASGTAAVVSSSVQQQTDGMLNLFITDKAAVEALTAEYQQYFALCRPLMRIFAGAGATGFPTVMDSLSRAEGDAFLTSAMPPLFALPEELAEKLAAQTGSEAFRALWAKSRALFLQSIVKQRLCITVLDPDTALQAPDKLTPPMTELFSANVAYTSEQYRTLFDHLLVLEKQYANLRVIVRSKLTGNLLLYVKEDVGVVMAKADAPMAAFVISDRNMINAFWDYLSGEAR